MSVERLERDLVNLRPEDLVDDPKEGDDRRNLGLSDEGGERLHVRQRALGVGQSHRVGHEVDSPESARMVPPVLAS